MSDMPRIYVASLSDYNCGELHGVWIDIEHDTDADTEVWPEIRAMLASSPSVANGDTDIAEEWAIHDYEGFGGYQIHEYDNIDDLVTVGCAIADNGEGFTAYLSLYGSEHSVDDLVSNFEDRYIGEMSIEDYAYESIQSWGVLNGLDEVVKRYFNYDAYARDMVLGGDVIEHNGHLFHGNF